VSYFLNQSVAVLLTYLGAFMPTEIQNK